VQELETSRETVASQRNRRAAVAHLCQHPNQHHCCCWPFRWRVAHLCQGHDQPACDSPRRSWRWRGCSPSAAIA
jgi:hypothetical protein